MNGFKYPERYALDVLIEKRPELVDMSVTAKLRSLTLESA